jgi:hypothetical protein
MVAASSRGRILEAFLFAVSSLVLYNLGVGMALFLVPLQVVATRRGSRGLVLASVLALLMLAGLRGVRYLTAGRNASWGILSAVELAVFVVILAGLLLVNLDGLQRLRGLTRLIAAAGAAGALAVPVILVVPRLPGYQEAMTAAFSSIAQTLKSVVPGGEAPAFLGPFLDPDKLMKTVSELFLRSYLLDLFMLFAFSWWAGSAAAVRTIPPHLRRAPPRLAEFRLEGLYLWPLIASWAAILLDLVVGISAASYVAWNVGLVLLFLYALQGLAIIRFVMQKHRLPGILWVGLLVVLAVLLASPRASLVVMIALPAFGVSENWIRYRIREQTPPDQSGKE